MRKISVHRAREGFTRLLREVEDGGAFEIYRGTTAVARLVPVRTQHARTLLPDAGAQLVVEAGDAADGVAVLVDVAP